LSLHGTALAPKFIFGINGQVLNGLFLIDDIKLIYIAGNNVVVYNMDERTQVFISGNEGYLGINCVNISMTNNLLVICERGRERAKLTVYSFTDAKKVKEIEAKEYEDCGYEC
jgi:hypothetical protein